MAIYFVALLLVVLSLMWLEGAAPQLVWPLVGVILLGVAYRHPTFATELTQLTGG